MDKKFEKLTSVVKQQLAEQLGVESEDINDEDSLQDDLRMNPTELTDFMQSLEEKGIDTADVDLTEIDTVTELVEALGSREYME